MNVIGTTLPKVKVSFDRKRPIKERVYLIRSEQVHRACLAIWDMDTIDLYEEFKVLYMDRRNGVMGYHCLSRGSCTSTVVDVKHILVIAISCNATGIILCHNHPSGKTNPSEADRQITQKINDAAKLFDIRLLDHLVIAREGYYSFCDEGLLGIESMRFFRVLFSEKVSRGLIYPATIFCYFVVILFQCLIRKMHLLVWVKFAKRIRVEPEIMYEVTILLIQFGRYKTTDRNKFIRCFGCKNGYYFFFSIIHKFGHLDG